MRRGSGRGAMLQTVAKKIRDRREVSRAQVTLVICKLGAKIILSAFCNVSVTNPGQSENRSPASKKGSRGNLSVIFVTDDRLLRTVSYNNGRESFATKASKAAGFSFFTIRRPRPARQGGTKNIFKSGRKVGGRKSNSLARQLSSKTGLAMAGSSDGKDGASDTPGPSSLEKC